MIIPIFCLMGSMSFAEVPVNQLTVQLCRVLTFVLFELFYFTALKNGLIFFIAHSVRSPDQNL